VSGRGGGSRHRARELALQTLYAIDVALRRAPRVPLHSVDIGAAGSAVEKALAAAEAAASRSLDAGGTPASRTPSQEEVRQVFLGIASHFEAPPGAQELAWQMVSSVCSHAARLDEQIAARSRNWRLSRMAAVDRNVLRLGADELSHTSTPAAVVIDEAVELARRYGSDASPAFVNGILDALAAELREASAVSPASGDVP
jgi:N utilization substance protein B